MSGATAFPNYAGANSPEGVVTAVVGKTYVDTVNGALYFKLSGSGNTGWAVGVGYSYDDDQASGLVGVGLDALGTVYVISGTARNIILCDRPALTGHQNQLSWQATGGDGSQTLFLQLGSTGQYSWSWTDTGITQMPGPIKTVPASSNTASAAFSTLAVDTPLQSSLGYDVLVSGAIKVASATNGTLAIGVGSGATPATDPFLTATTSATALIIPYSAVVPAGYYLSIVSGGTISITSITAVATPL